MELKTAKHKAIRAMIEGTPPSRIKGIEAKALARINLQLSALASAQTIRQVADASPNWHVHELKPGQPGVWSMRVTPNWRLTFRLDQKTGTITDLDFLDYH